MSKYSLNTHKAISSLLYILDKLGGEWDKYATLKILYFAECQHLAKYGRPIIGDEIVAMEYGPVMSFCYDAVKPKWLGNNYFDKKDDNVIKAKKKPFEMGLFSESDLECIDESIAENKNLGFGAIKMKSHDLSYNNTVKEKGLNKAISYYDIASAYGAKDGFLEYMKERDEETDI